MHLVLSENVGNLIAFNQIKALEINAILFYAMKIHLGALQLKTLIFSVSSFVYR